MNIIFYGGHYWERGAWFRKQRFAKRLSNRGHTIFYIEKSVSCIRKTKKDKNNYIQTSINKVSNNFYLIKPSTYFPFPEHPLSNYLYQLKLFFDLRRIINKYIKDEYLIWFNNLNFSSSLKHFKGIFKIFDLCDDLPFYSILAGNEKQYINKISKLKNALKLSNLNIVSAIKLKEKYQKYSTSKIIIAPNGYEFIVEKNHNQIEIPKEMKKLKRPIIGFIGTLFRFIDENLLEYLIRQRPNYSFVFIGKIEKNFNINKIDRYDNVYLFGEKKKYLIASYIQNFDICLNPFKVHEVNDSVNPVKVFEYLAFNKRVVSTKMYSLMNEHEISKYIHFANNYEEYLFIIDKLVKEKSYCNMINKEDIQKYHWDAIFEKLINEINSRANLNL